MKRNIAIFAAAASVVVGGWADSLENAKMRLEFGSAGDGFAVVGIVNKSAGEYRFVQGGNGTEPDLWQLKFVRSDTGEVVYYSNRDARGEKSVRHCGADRISFCWKGIPLPAGDGSFDVTAGVRLPEAGPSEWRIECRSRGKLYALSQTRYPVLRRIAPFGETDVLRPYPSTGMCLLRNSDNKDGGRPCYPGPYPMMLGYMTGEAGLYFAADDGEARIKTMVMEPGEEHTAYFETTIENAGVPGKAATGPGYGVVVDCFKGDWWKAAELYRNWALRQRWCAKGPIVTRGGSAKRAADRQLWVLGGGTAEAVDRMIDGIGNVWPGIEVGLEWCNWYFQPDNLGNPEFFPCRQNMDVVQKKGVERGLLMMPYVNPHLWDAENAGFRYAQVDALRAENGELEIEYWPMAGYGQPKVKHPYAQMCPAAKTWQDIVVSVCEKQMTNVNANAFYLDQMACASAIPCYAPSHGHPVGGGAWYADGNRAILQRIRDFGERHGGVVITSEQTAEMWIALMDALLVCDPPLNARQVPFWQAVYSDYTTYYGYPGDSSDAPEEYFRKIAQPFVWGIVPGWLHSVIAFQEKYRELANLLGKMAKFRAANMEYLGYGRLIGEFKPLEAADGVVGALWENVTTGKRAMALANTAAETRTVHFLFPDASEPRVKTLEPMELAVVEE